VFYTKAQAITTDNVSDTNTVITPTDNASGGKTKSLGLGASYPSTCTNWNGSGNGLSMYPFLVKTVDNLACMANLVNHNYNLAYQYKYWKQTADIDLGGQSAGNWIPIGNEGEPFIGNYDGNHYTISNLYINASTRNYQGLFGYTEDATLTNIGLVNTNITGNVSVGGLSGKSGTVENSYNTGTITGQFDTGGLLGKGGTIQDSYNTATVTALYNTGGLSGTGSTIQNSYNTGTVTGSNYTGGLTGTSGTIQNSYNTGSVTGIDNTGGLSGNGGTIENSVNLSKSTAGLDGYVFSRISSGGKKTNNYGYIGTSSSSTSYQPFTGDNGTGSNGIDTSCADFASGSAFWRTKVGLSAYVWTSENGKLPTLKDTGGTQNPQYYCMVTPIAPTDNGKHPGVSTGTIDPYKSPVNNVNQPFYLIGGDTNSTLRVSWLPLNSGYYYTGNILQNGVLTSNTVNSKTYSGITSDYTIKPIINYNSYKLHFNSLGGDYTPPDLYVSYSDTEPNEEQIKGYKIPTKPNDPESPSEYFDGWYNCTNYNCGEYELGTHKIYNNVDLYDKWVEEPTWDIKFHPVKNLEIVGTTSDYVETGQSIDFNFEVPPNQNAQGHSYTDLWYSCTNYKDRTTCHEWDKKKIINNANDIPFGEALYTFLTPKKVDITYELNGGFAGQISPKTGTYDEVLTVSDPVKTGYTFINWVYGNNNDIWTQSDTLLDINHGVRNANWDATGNPTLTLNAVWEFNSNPTTDFYVTYIPNKNLQSWTDTVKLGTTAKMPVPPTTTDSTFLYWHLSGTDTPFDFTTTITDDTVLYGAWEDIPYIPTNTDYQVIFNSNGGTPIDPVIVTYGGTITKPADPIKTGYTFLYWHLSGTDTPFDFTTTITDDTVLYGAWEDTPYIPTNTDYQVIFNSNGGTPIETQTVKYEKTAIEPKDPVKQGFIFKYWYQTSTDTPFNFNTQIRNNTTLTALWQIIEQNTCKNGAVNYPICSIDSKGNIVNNNISNNTDKVKLKSIKKSSKYLTIVLTKKTNDKIVFVYKNKKYSVKTGNKTKVKVKIKTLKKKFKSKLHLRKKAKSYKFKVILNNTKTVKLRFKK
jgi:uncharacterized repeat protein (TIGR02543 family)